MKTFKGHTHDTGKKFLSDKVLFKIKSFKELVPFNLEAKLMII